jgi:hypothetical protein
MRYIAWLAGRLSRLLKEDHDEWSGALESRASEIAPMIDTEPAHDV